MTEAERVPEKRAPGAAGAACGGSIGKEAGGCRHVDMNKTIRREHFQFPKVEEIASKLVKATVFTILDAVVDFDKYSWMKKCSRLCIFDIPFDR